MTDDILAQQIAYYRARAAEYDQWFLRTGRYDRGPEVNAAWHAEWAELRTALDAFRPAGDVLELASGTGLWTERLLRHARRIVAVDAAPEAVSISQVRCGGDPRVKYVVADLFSCRPAALGSFDVVIFAFWLSHVPPERFSAFWDFVASSLRPGGRVFFVDSRRDPTSTAQDHVLPSSPEQIALERRLNDGRCYTIYKLFYETEPLRRTLQQLGWEFQVVTSSRYFLWGQGKLVNPLRAALP